MSPQADSGASRSPDAPNVLTGVTLDGRYRVGRVVAEGGFSIVYAGEHLALGIPIAVKTLKQRGRSTQELDDDAVERFHAEARLVARLEHPSIVRVFDTGVWRAASGRASTPWLVLEWLDGQTLKEYFTARHDSEASGATRPRECMPWVRALFSAVAHAHAAGVTHRDIKPSNVCLVRGTGGGQAIKLLDFGIAKLGEVGRAPESGDTVTDGEFRAFSKHYAAPEQLAGSRTGPWTDAHGLGLLLTELLTGRAPYEAEDATALGQSIFNDVRPTPARFGVDVSSWEPIIAELLAVRGRDRPRNLMKTLEQLEQTLGQADAAWLPPRAAPPRPVSHGAAAGQTLSAVATSAPTKRSRWPLALALALAVTAVAAVSSSFKPADRAGFASSASLPHPEAAESGLLPPPEPSSGLATEASPASSLPVSTKPRARSAMGQVVEPPARQPARPSPAVLSVAPLPSASGAAALPYELE